MVHIDNQRECFPPPHFNRTFKPDPKTMSERAWKRLVRDAHQYLSGYGLDFSQLSEPVFEAYDMLTGNMTWTHKTTGEKVVLSSIWWDKKTGAILQAGTNYGDLTL